MTKRTPEQIKKCADKILAYVVKHPATNVEDLQKGLKLTNAETALPIRQLIAAKKLKAKGKARATRYTAR